MSDQSRHDAIGLSLQMVSTFLAALAYVLQKKAHVEIEACGGLHVQPWGHAGSKKALWRWRVGFIVMIVCAVLDLLSYPLLDLSKQAPMGAVTLMWNTVLASLILKEMFTVLDLICTCFIVVGTILSVSNSEPNSKEFTFPEILDYLKDDVVYAYSAIVIPGILIAIYFIERITVAPFAKWTRFQRRFVAIVAPGLGGMCMGYTGYGAKALSTVVGAGAWDQLKNPLIYVYVLLAIIAVTGQLRYLNKGLEFYDALQVVPVFQVFIIFSNACAGIVYYHDMRSAAGYMFGLFAFGGLLCVVGIVLMLLKTQRPKGRGRAISKSVLAANLKALSSSGHAVGAGEVHPLAVIADHSSNGSGGSNSIMKSRSGSSKRSTSPTKHLSIAPIDDNDHLPLVVNGSDAATAHPGTPLIGTARRPDSTGGGGGGTSRRRAVSSSVALTIAAPSAIGAGIQMESFQLDDAVHGRHGQLSPAPDASPAVTAPLQPHRDLPTTSTSRRTLSLSAQLEGEGAAAGTGAGPKSLAHELDLVVEEDYPIGPVVWYEREVAALVVALWLRFFPNTRCKCCAAGRRYSELEA